MTKYIFEEVIRLDNIFLIIEEHFEDVEEREHMKHVVRDTVHHKLIDFILDTLQEEQKVEFLLDISDEEKHPSLFEKLKTWISDLENKLTFHAGNAEKEMLRLISID